MSRPLDRLTLLETFVRIADRGSISAAARDLGMSQASASRQLKELEGRLNLQLIRRTTHSLALTQAGIELLHDAREMLSSWETFQEKHSEDDRTIQGPIKVIAPVALGQLYLADIALDFQMQHPGVSLTWELNDQVIRFAEIGCDCWIKIGAVPDETLVVKEIGCVERLVVANPALLQSHSKPTSETVSELPFVALSPFEGTRISLQSNHDDSLDFEPRVCISTNNIFAVYRAVMKGTGAAILPRWFVQCELDRGTLIDVLPGWRAEELSINMAYMPGRRQPRRLSSFLQSIADGIQSVPGVK